MITHKKLERLYINRKLSSYKIASLLGVSQSWIMANLRKHKINRRTIPEAKVLTKPWYKRKNFSGDQREKAYIIGFRTGDLYVSQTSPKSHTIRISSNSTIIEQRNLFKKLFKKYGHIWESNPDKKNAVSVRCYLNKSFDFLLPKEDIIDKWILKNKNNFLEFLAGYIDAEGTFCVGKNKVFSLSSQDKNIIHEIHKKINDLGIACNAPTLVRKKNALDKNNVISNKNVWGIRIYRKKTLLKFIKLVELFIRHGKKTKDMLNLKSKLLGN